MQWQNAMEIERRIQAFSRLGEMMKQVGTQRTFNIDDDGMPALEESFEKAVEANPWFTEENIFSMMEALGNSLEEPSLRKWMAKYPEPGASDPATIAIIMAGNIPLVGFHDLTAVLMSGHRMLARLSSGDRFLMPALAGKLMQVEPAFRDYIVFTDEILKGFDAVIATGSNNTSRYFDYYFGKYPHIIRKNRNALAVIGGKEGHRDLKALGEDIFRYYGLGCRNVSKLLLPADYDPAVLFEALESFAATGDHHKYRNNYDYNKSVMLVNRAPHYDNGFLLLKEEKQIPSPVSVLHYERYDSLEWVNQYIAEESDKLQCVVSSLDDVKGSIRPGSSQHPELWDYADGVDTMGFLLGIGGRSA